VAPGGITLLPFWDWSWEKPGASDSRSAKKASTGMIDWWRTMQLQLQFFWMLMMVEVYTCLYNFIQPSGERNGQIGLGFAEIHHTLTGIFSAAVPGGLGLFAAVRH